MLTRASKEVDEHNDQGETSCLDAVQCAASEYCWQPEGAFEGECQASDFGKSCQSDSDCAYNLCIFDSGADSFGECTRGCTVASECPASWSCVEPEAGANFNTNFCDNN